MPSGKTVKTLWIASGLKRSWGMIVVDFGGGPQMVAGCFRVAGLNQTPALWRRDTVINVACPSCKSGYDVDETRLPTRGLKMRCPQCSNTFWVGAKGLLSAPPPPPPSKAAKGKIKQTMIGASADLPAPKGAPPVRKRAQTAMFGGGIDLPKPADKSGPFGNTETAKKPAVPSKPPQTMTFGDSLDLPAVSRASDAQSKKTAPKIDLPAPAAPKNELPAPVAPKKAKTMVFGDGIDLPKPAPPAPPARKRAATAMFGDGMDLPKPADSSPKSPSADLDLPAVAKPSTGVEDLPAVSGGADLPAPVEANLPAPSPNEPEPVHAVVNAPTVDETAGFEVPQTPDAEADLGLDLGGAGLDDGPIATPFDAPAGDASSDFGGGLDLDGLDLDGGGLDLDGGGNAGSGLDLDGGGLDLDGGAGLDLDGGGLDLDGGDDGLGLDGGGLDLGDAGGSDFSDFGGGADFDGGADAGFDGGADFGGDFDGGSDGGGDFGDLDLPDGDPLFDGGDDDAFGGDDDGGFDDFDFEAEAGESAEQDLEFEDLPQGEIEDEAERRQRKSKKTGSSGLLKWVSIAAITIVVIGGAGYALRYSPFGVFGIYLWEQYLPSAGSAADASAAIKKAEDLAASGVYKDVKASLVLLAKARTEHSLNRELMARSALHEALYAHDFGGGTATAVRQTRLRNWMEKRSMEGPEVDLAEAADALRQQKYAKAVSKVGANTSDPYALLIKAEAELGLGNYPAVEKTLTKAKTARARWVLARAAIAAAATTAEKAIDDVLAISADHAAARVAKATFLFKREEDDKAEKVARDVAGISEKKEVNHARERAAAQTLLANLFVRRGNLSEADKHYRRAIELSPSSPDALVGRGQILLQQARFQEALALFDSATDVALAESHLWVEAQIGAARSLIGQKLVLEAEKRLAVPQLTKSENAEVHVWRGRALALAGKKEEAQKAFEQAISVAEENVEGYRAYAEFLLDEDKAAEAAKVLSDARKKVKEPGLHRALGDVELKRNRFAQAITSYTRAIKNNANDVASMLGRAIAYRRSGDLENADTSLKLIEEIDPQYPRLALERGRLFEAKGDLTEAIAAYQAAFKASPEDEELRLRLGAVYAVAERYEEAAPYIKKYRKGNPTSAEGLHYAGRIALAEGKINKALELLSQSVSGDALNAVYHSWYAAALLEANQLVRAKEEAAAAVKEDEALAHARWVQGEIQERQGAVSDATASFEKALALDPSLVAAKVGLARALDQLGKRKDSIKLLEEALVEKSDKGQWWYLLAHYEADEGHTAQALAAAEKGDRTYRRCHAGTDMGCRCVPRQSRRVTIEKEQSGRDRSV